MQIDWITVLAQLVNFLILVWLLNRFLFKPVVRVMSEREALIEQRLMDASLASTEAQRACEEYQKAKADTLLREQEIMDNAVARANEEQQRLTETAREEVEQRRISWLRNLDEEKRDARRAFRLATASSAQLLTDALLRKISNRSLNEQMISSFIDQLNQLDSSVLARLKRDIKTVTVVSAIELDSASKRSLTRAIHEIVDNTLKIDYQVDGELIAGVRLIANGTNLEWHLQSMLQAEESRVTQMLEAVDDRAY